jgi:hypothetical protein
VTKKGTHLDDSIPVHHEAEIQQFMADEPAVQRNSRIGYYK